LAVILLLISAAVILSLSDKNKYNLLRDGEWWRDGDHFKRLEHALVGISFSVSPQNEETKK
jgi:hypothetical protein